VTQWVRFDTAADVAAAAADTIEEHSRHAIQHRGEFKIVLAGGTTPAACYELLAQRSLQRDKWKLFYGDERCLPLSDPLRNHQMVIASGLADKVGRHFIMPAETDVDKAAAEYQGLIQDQIPFDIVLLGMGKDGHTASLFPGKPWAGAPPDQLVIPVDNAPKPPANRISLTRHALQNCLQMLVLVTGESKKPALKKWRKGGTLPIAQVADINQAVVYVEKELME